MSLKLKRQVSTRESIIFNGRCLKITFWEGQNHRDGKEVSGCQGLEMGRGVTTKGLKGLSGVMEIATLGKAFQMVLDEKSISIQIGVPYWTCTPSSLLSVCSSL